MHHRTSRRLAAAARSARPRFASRPAIEPLEGRRLLSASARDEPAAEPAAEPTGSISGLVFRDTNRDGVFSPGEAGSAAVPYLDLNGNAAYDAGEPGGQPRTSFSFTGLAAGRYTLRFGSATGSALPPTTTPAGEPKYEIDLAPGQAVTDRNLGLDVSTAIYGTVFEDRDRDGTRDPGEAAAFETLYLDVDGDRVFRGGVDINFGSFGFDGYYEVVGLAPGTYTLWRQNPGSRQQTTPATPTWDGVATFTLAAGESRAMPTLGVAPFALPSALRVPVYADWDQDGALGPGDTPTHPLDAQLTTVYADLNNSRVREPSEPVAFYSTPARAYEFASLQPDDYLVRVQAVDQGRAVVTSPSDGGSVRVTRPPAGGPVTVAPVMLHAPTPYAIVGTLWDDANANRVRDPGEAPLAGRTVWLDRNSNRLPDAGERITQTGADGGYAFPNTPAGQFPGHDVRQLVPAGWTETAPLFQPPVTIQPGSPAAEFRRDFGSARVYQRPADQAADEGAARDFDLGRFTPGLYSAVVTVNWGDGTPAESFGPLPGGPQAPIGPRAHAYADDGEYTVAVTVRNGPGGTVLGAGTFGVSVANVAPAAALGGPATVNERTPTTFTFAATDASPSDAVVRWVVDWGDGSAAEEFPGTATSATHAFPAGGESRTVTATAYDDDGGAGRATLVVRVRTPAEAVADVRLAVDALAAAGRLTGGQHDGLAKKLDAARDAIVDGRNGKAAGQLARSSTRWASWWPTGR